MSSIIDQAKTYLSENLGGVAHNLAPEGTRFSLDEVPDLSGKVAVVTGGSQGIGYGCTHTLLDHNVAKLFILSGHKEVVDKAVDAVREELGEEKASRTKWIQCDLGNWKRVEEVAKEISNSTDRLDILINNAGRGIMSFELTEYGIDRHMAVNHFGHVILTSRLLPLIKKTAEQGHTVRISNQASNLHESAPQDSKFESADELAKDYGPNPLYGRAKLAAILYSRYLNRHLTKQQPKILVNATHPGIVYTKMSQEDIHEPYPLAGYGMSIGLAPFKKNQFEACLSSIYAGTVIEKSGRYICPPAADEPGSAMSQDEQVQENLMNLTKKLLSEKGGINVELY